MKLLHTSDWHLGKKIENRSRLGEQREALSELSEVCEREKIDIVLVAGDIFDTYSPPAEAEALFYESILMLSRGGRHIVILPGNHDDPERLSAAAGLAKMSGIYIIGGLSNERYTRENVTGGRGWLKINKNGETLNLALLPFPSMSRLDKMTDMDGGSFEEKVKNLLAECCNSCFTPGGINVLMSHLYLGGLEASDEKELGTAQMLPKDIIPQNALYTALGHIHKPQTVSKSRNIYYSGSLLNYSFDEKGGKRFLVIDTDGKQLGIKEVPVKAGRKLVRITAKTVEEAERLLAANEGCYAELTYESAVPLKPSEAAAIKSYDSYTKLKIISNNVKREITGRVDKNPSELFSAFFESKLGKEPDPGVVDIFLRVLNGEDII